MIKSLLKFAFAFLLTCLALFFFSACSNPTQITKTTDGIVAELDGAAENGKKIRFLVISDNIIRVTVTPTDSFSSKKSLMVVPQSTATPFNVIEDDQQIGISTKSLVATISRKTGEVVFKDNAGNILLEEKAGGGKTLTPSPAEQNAFSIQQIFESPANEAFYGLGGHQNGQMNYKGEDVELVQHNIVDVVPFIYSSKNYGILWDNYSISKFGDPRDYQPLSSLTLTGKDDESGGLTATYHKGDSVLQKSIDSQINYEFLETPEFEKLSREVDKIVYEGSISSEAEGKHKLLVYASGYCKVWIDNELVMDKWRQNWNPWTHKIDVALEKGKKKSIKIEWITQGGYFSVKHLNPYPADQQNRLSLYSEVADEIDYYFVYGKNADDIIKGYRQLTGKAPIVPKWALGFWQSRERYRNQEEMINVIREYRKRGIPLDNIVLDWQYWEDPKWGSHEFDLTRFPDPAGMVKEIHKLNANLMISVWPKFNKGTAHFDEMNSQGFLFRNNVDKKRKDWVGIGYESTFYDPFNEKAGQLFWNQIDEHLNSLGIDAWWLDATEPDMHSNISIEERKVNMTPTAMGSGARFFNAYSLMNSKSVYEGQRKSSPDKRVFILTRSAYAGQQRYGAATWSGDIVTTWSDFKDQIATGINFSLSGIPYWTMDIGGFAAERRFETAKGEDLKEWREMNARWFQYGAFCPLFRSHGQFPFREIYNLAETNDTYYNSMVYYDKLRYHLMPYIYSVAGDCYWNDQTFMRGLVMDFNSDSQVHNIADQYMFGPSILVNPVYTYGSKSRQVYLPANTGWYNFYTGEYLKGGQSLTANAPVDRMPLFVKAGSILPLGPEIQYTSEKPADPITLFIFTGSNATFALYEDEGINYQYEKGEYSLIPMSWDEDAQTLKIGARKGAFKGMQEERTFRIVWVKTDQPVGVSENARPDQVIRYSGDEITLRMN